MCTSGIMLEDLDPGISINPVEAVTVKTMFRKIIVHDFAEVMAENKVKFMMRRHMKDKEKLIVIIEGEEVVMTILIEDGPEVMAIVTQKNIDIGVMQEKGQDNTLLIGRKN